MSLVTASGLVKAYGDQDVLAGITLAVPRRARIALVGPNGVGKTTLLRILVGLEKPDQGRVHWARNLRMGYLPQDLSFAPLGPQEGQRTVWESAMTAFSDLRKREAELARLEREMADPRLADKAMERYGELQQDFERAGGYGYVTKAQRVLHGLGLSAAFYERRLLDLSGGERTRAMLAHLLLDEPDLLLLDEPTNHLDMEGVEWLEAWLRDWRGAAVIVCHDRYFLDRTVTAVWDLTSRGLDLYRGNYSDYAQQRWERHLLQAKLYQKQQEYVRRQQDYIQRNIAGQNSRQAKGRQKRLNRMLREEAVERLRLERTVQVDLGNVARAGDRVIETHGLVVAHPETGQALVAVPDLVLARGECAAIIGPNGVGKTTFLRTLKGEIAPREGEVRLGASLKLGYLSQAQEDLGSSQTVLQEVQAVVPQWKEGQLRSFLARFLFQADTVGKAVSVLSGGERARLALAKLALQGANLLLLDEPTTHLDILSQEAMQEAIKEFPGTVLLVSHDRYLIDKLATQVWAISPHSQRLELYRGGYAEYAALKAQAASARQPPSGERRRPQTSKPSSRIRKQKVDELEARIAALEGGLNNLARQLEQPGTDLEEVRNLGQRYVDLQLELDRNLAEWERVARSEDQGQ